MAGFLDQLKASDVKKEAFVGVSDKTQVVRRKTVEAIDFQLSTVQAAIDNVDMPRPTVMKYVDMPDGRRVKQEVELKRLTRWWGKVGKTYVTTIKYGTSNLLNSSGKDTFVAGETLEDLRSFYNNLMKAVSEGVLDEDLLKASKERGAARLGKKRGEQPEADRPELVVELEPEEIEEPVPARQPVRRVARR